VFVVGKCGQPAVVGRIIVTENVAILPVQILVPILDLAWVVYIFDFDKFKTMAAAEKQGTTNISLLGVVALLGERGTLHKWEGVDHLLDLGEIVVDHAIS
jgi:hypothetical protein